MKQKSIDQITRDARFGDLVLLALPASVQTCGGAIYGTDYAVGFVSHADDRNLYLNNLQKKVFKVNEPPIAYSLKDIAAYQILRRFKLNPKEDGIDEALDTFISDVGQLSPSDYPYPE